MATKTKTPNQRAHELLASYMDDEQRACYDQHGHFYVTVEQPRTKSGRKRPTLYFLLKGGWEVFRIDGRGPQTMHCLGVFEPEYRHGYIYNQLPVPREDSLLTQMLLLQTDLKLFREIACAAGMQGCDYWLLERNINWKLGFPGQIKE